jgi:hypothetical protein
MATQPPPPPPPRNGESINLSLGGKSVGIQAGNLIPILLLLFGGLGGYLIFIALDHRITTLLERQERIVDTTNSTKEAVIEALKDQRAFLAEQVHGAQQRLAAQNEAAKRLLTIHDFNANRPPSERLPLETSPENLPHPQAPPR